MPKKSRPTQKKFHYAVIGRIPFDDEDSCWFYHTTSTGAAEALFTHEIYAERYGNAAAARRAENERGEGAAVYINHVLKSKTRIGYVNTQP